MVSSNDVQQLFLQAVFSRGVLSAKLAQTLWEKSFNVVQAADNTLDIPFSKERNAWDAFVAQINKSIDSLDLEFRHLHDETTGKEMYALVNRKGDDIAQMATDYNPADITYFKAIVEQIMLAPRQSFSVSSMAALREVSAIKPKSNMSKSQAEVVLGSFVAQGWLLKSKRGRYSLTTRSLLELLPYLKSTYPDEMIECTICMEITTRGIACHTTNCKTRMHYHCFNTYRRRHGSCPSCSVDWPREASEHLIPVGEGAVRDGEDGRRRTRVNDDASDDGEDGAGVGSIDENEPSQLQSQPKTQRTLKNKRGKAPALVDTSASEVEGEDPKTPIKKSQPNRRSSRK